MPEPEHRLKEAIETEPAEAMSRRPELKRALQQSPLTAELLDIAAALEGLNRHAGMHAAGVVIAEKPLWEYVPVFRRPVRTTIVTQFAMNEVEKAGLVKFDFLGLKTLTVIQTAVELINRNRRRRSPLDLEDIPLDDADVCEMIAQGDTTGVFQLESSGFREMLKKLKPDCFEDIVAAVALYRPGPLEGGMVDDFIDRKHGRKKVTYPHPALEPMLKDTYGVIVYQEQVMQIAQVLGGYSLGGADLLRRAMGKKKAEVMQPREPASSRAQEEQRRPEDRRRGLRPDGEVRRVRLQPCHSAAYGLITYQTAYLKPHYPVEFMAALLTCDKDNTDKVVKHIAEARESGTQVLPPDVNQSDMAFGAVDGKIRFGLGAIKGVGEGAIESIVEARKEGPFKGLFDFCERVDSRRVNRKVLEALVKAGAFDFEKRPRRQLFETIEKAMNRGSASQKDKAAGQSSLFGMLAGPSSGSGGAAMKDDFAAVEEWVEKERLSYEKEAIGFYVSGHPLYAYEKELKRYARPVTAVQRARRDEKISVGGIIAAMRERPTKTGKRMAWVTLEDLSGSIELVCFPGKDGTRSVMGKDGKWSKQGPKPGYEHWEPLLKGDDPILVTGSVQISQRDEDAPTAELIVEDIQSLKAVREKRTKRLELRVPADLLTEEKLAKLLEIAKKNVGTTPVAVSVLFPGEAEALIGGTPAQGAGE